MQCVVDVKGPHGPPSTEDIQNHIIPELKTSVVQYVLDQEDASAYPSEDFQCDNITFVPRGVSRNEDKGTAIFYVRFNYKQKLKKTKEPFVYAFRRHVGSDISTGFCFDQDSLGVRKVFAKNGMLFKFRSCQRA